MSGTLLSFYRIWIQVLFFIAPDKAAWRVLMLFATPRIRKSRERETEALAKARAQDIEINGKRIRTYCWGNAAPEVLLVHGWEGRAGNMGGFAAEFEKRGISSLAFDAPAHGDSEGKRSTVFAYADVMAEIFKQNPSLRIIVSHSFGSAASIYALTRKKHSIKQLVLLSTPDSLLDVFNEFYVLLKLKPKQRERIFTSFEINFGYRVTDLQVSRDASQANVERALLLHDRNDSQIPYSNAEKVAAAWPILKLIPLQDVGHYRMLWNEDVLRIVFEELDLKPAQ
jgi:pimeloyl-ACP methyl ester carboxylesterase